VYEASPEFARRLFAEFLGTGLLVTVIVGSGIAAQQLSPSETGLQLLENSTATALADWFLGRRLGAGLTLSELGAYTIAQCAGGILGAVLANVMFDVGQHLSIKHRVGGGHLIGEVVATAGLIALIFALARTKRGLLAAPAVGAYIGAAYWFTSSTSFANPAVTVGRMFTDTFAGIAPSSVPAFIGMQVVGAAIGIGIVLVLYPDAEQRAGDVVIPHADARRPAVKATS
jgi:glycerol uptake facilitator-like aquaporin